MRKLFGWGFFFTAMLLSLSAFFYYLHYLIFHDPHHIFLYLIGDIAFVFIEVLLVTVVIHRLLTLREKQIMLRKLNMVIGVFFCEVGTPLFKLLHDCDAAAQTTGPRLLVTAHWRRRDFAQAKAFFRNYSGSIDTLRGDLAGIKTFLSGQRGFLLRLLENPNLLEHETFTNLLWSIFHLTEELMFRIDLSRLGDPDRQHLEGDIRRVYHLLISKWLAYMAHLQIDYPYLFSLALRTNPFDPAAAVEVR